MAQKGYSRGETGNDVREEASRVEGKSGRFEAQSCGAGGKLDS